MQGRYSVTRDDKVLAALETEQEALSNATMCSFRNSKVIIVTDTATHAVLYRIQSGTILDET